MHALILPFLLSGLFATSSQAASLVGLAVKQGARVVLVSRGEAPYDAAETLRQWEGISEMPPPAVELSQ